jgi:putative hemolysin
MTPVGKDYKYVDLEKMISESESELLKKLPRFIIKWISKIIMQDELNLVLNKYSDYTGADFLIKMIEEFNLKLEIEGKENLPENGKCFFASNHPFGIIDGLILTYVVSNKYGTLKAIANDAFMYIPQLRPFIASVNVYERNSKDYIKALELIYTSEIPITHFPAGEVSRLYHGKVQDAAWQKSFITKAISCGRDIVPFYFYGRNSNLFYMIYTIRKLFGVKLNIELMLLPHEMFNKRNKSIKVRIGKPIPFDTFDASLTHKEWAQKVRDAAYDLGSSNLSTNYK